jgi:magnesium transporter
MAQASIRQPIPEIPWRTVESSALGDLKSLAKAEGYHVLDIEDCQTKKQIAKVVERESYVFIVAKVIRFDTKSQRLIFDDFNIFVKPDSVVTVEEHPGTLVERVSIRFKDTAGVGSTSVARLVHAILDEIMDEYLATLDTIGETISGLEEKILKDSSADMQQRLFRSRRALIEFRRNAGDMRAVVSTLIRHPRLETGGELEYYFRDVYEHSIRVIEFVESYRDVLNGLFDIHISSVANRTNEAVKVLTVYSIVVLPLLIVPGFYGMNIKLPFQSAPHAFSIVVAIMTVFTVGVLLFLRWRKWF